MDWHVLFNCAALEDGAGNMALDYDCEAGLGMTTILSLPS
jgi:hypothetical protein